MIPEDQFDFLHAVWIRRSSYTYVFFALNILVFLLMALAGGSTNEATLMAFCVKSNDEIAKGQWWRFVTPIFIHIGLLHLFFNSYALWIVGPQVEKLYGGGRFVILYVLTGVAGVYGSYAYHPNTISAGASGRSEERRVRKSGDVGGGRMTKKKGKKDRSRQVQHARDVN